MSNKKQTAVEWLADKLNNDFGNNDFLISYANEISQAKEMEKQQMFEYIKNNYCIGHRSLEFHRLEFEEYYNETFNK